MIIKLKQCLADKEQWDKRKITLDEVAEKAGIGRATLTRMINKRDYHVGLDIIDKLCDYFNCDINTLLVRAKKDR
ncbi:helix-turn-helix domain-containing protein [Brumicola pallidula]|uniref:helix-turn-helix domain-containing protein n=1 Tax=Brumicola pallidula TaxID=56807 RepID=UPI00047A69CD|nr:helix-turn-helix transcriptional regulator [Glaciecola pallidula]